MRVRSCGTGLTVHKNCGSIVAHRSRPESVTGRSPDGRKWVATGRDGSKSRWAGQRRGRFRSRRPPGWVQNHRFAERITRQKGVPLRWSG